MILTLILFIIIIADLFTCILPFIGIAMLFAYNGIQIFDTQDIIFFTKCAVFTISCLFITYLTLNLVFGFSVFKKSLRLKNYKLSLRYGNLLSKPFEDIQERLKLYSTKLMISPENEVKAYIIASLGRSIICISIGMLDALRVRTKTDEDFQKAISGIIATQGIQIAKCTYFPQQMIDINSSVISFIKNILKFVSNILCKIIGFIPLFGDPISKIIRGMIFIIEYFINTTHKTLFGLYYLIVKIRYINSRFTFEKQAAKIVGGESVSLALSLTNEAKFSITSSPKRLNKRIKKIEEIQKNEEVAPISGSKWKVTALMLIFFGVVVFLGYDIQIWRAWKFIQGVVGSYITPQQF